MEKLSIETMIKMYCLHIHGNQELCADCSEILDYAFKRIEICPYQPDKPACAECPIHCYSADMRERIRLVMRYAGPRMWYRHPIVSLYHLRTKNKNITELPPKKDVKNDKNL
jgi:hypothetical protein